MKIKPVDLSKKEWFTFRLKKVALCSLFIGSIISETAFGFTPANDWPVYTAYYLEKEEPDYHPRIDIAGYNFVVGSGTTGLVDALLPIIQNPSNLIYSNLRFTSQFLSPYDAAVGLGYRHLSQNQQSMIGFYVFYDLRGSDNRKIYNQVTAGGEYWYKKFYSGFTTYLPVGRTENLFSTQQGPYLVNIEKDRRNIFMASQDFEKVMTGFDVELGYEALPGLIAYGGGYAFFAKDVGNIAGPRVRIQYDLRTLLGDFDDMGKVSMDRLAFESEVRHDSLRGVEVFAGLRMRLRYGIKADQPKKRYPSVIDKMTSLARHDINLAPFNTRREYLDPVLNNNGNHLLIGDVSNEIEFKKVVDPNKNVDVIAAHGEFAVSEKVNLNDDAVLTAGDFDFIHNDQPYTVKLSDGAILNTAQGIGLGANNLVRDITVNSEGPWALQSASNSIGQTTISNVTTNAGFQFVSAEKGIASLTVDNANLNLQGENLTGIDVSGEGIEFNLNNSRIHVNGNDVTGIVADGHVNLSASNVLVTAEGGNATGIKAGSVNLENNSTVQVIGKTTVGVEANMESIKTGNNITAIGDDAIGLKGSLLSNDARIIATRNSENFSPEDTIIAIGNNNATGVFGTVESNTGQITGHGEGSFGAENITSNLGQVIGGTGGVGAGTITSNHGVISGSNIGNSGIGANNVITNELDGIIIGYSEGGFGVKNLASNLGHIYGELGGVGAGTVESNAGTIFSNNSGTGANTVNINQSDGKINSSGKDSLGANIVESNLGEIFAQFNGVGANVVQSNSGLIEGARPGNRGNGGLGVRTVITNEESGVIKAESDLARGAETVEINFGTILAIVPVNENGQIFHSIGAATVNINESTGKIIGNNEGATGAVTVKNNNGGTITSINGGKGAGNLNDTP